VIREREEKGKKNLSRNERGEHTPKEGSNGNGRTGRGVKKGGGKLELRGGFSIKKKKLKGSFPRDLKKTPGLCPKKTSLDATEDLKRRERKKQNHPSLPKLSNNKKRKR